MCHVLIRCLGIVTIIFCCELNAHSQEVGAQHPSHLVNFDSLFGRYLNIRTGINMHPDGWCYFSTDRGLKPEGFGTHVWTRYFPAFHVSFQVDSTPKVTGQGIVFGPFMLMSYTEMSHPTPATRISLLGLANGYEPYKK